MLASGGPRRVQPLADARLGVQMAHDIGHDRRDICTGCEHSREALERHEDGSISIEGEKVDDPDAYRGDPIKGGPTDPDAPELPGERKQREKLERRQQGRSD